jgi:6-pyruvoyltetrahydropterin/6-carboxytetrahydropterin synthase
MAPRYRYVFAKRDFHFSSTHFIIFGPNDIEHLHGHNFYVRVELSGSILDSNALLVDANSFKKELRQLCARLDRRTLLQANSPLVKITHIADLVEVQVDQKIYRFPEDNILALPLRNTSLEDLAAYIWRELSPLLSGTSIDNMVVAVEGTEGLSCCYEDQVVPQGERVN